MKRPTDHGRTIEQRISGKLAMRLADGHGFNLAGLAVGIDCDTYEGDSDGETVLYVDHAGQRYEVTVRVSKSDAKTYTDLAKERRG